MFRALLALAYSPDTTPA